MLLLMHNSILMHALLDNLSYYIFVLGCQVCGPWDGVELENLAKQVQHLRLCSQRLNKLDQEMMQQCWPGRVLSRNSKCLLSVVPVNPI